MKYISVLLISILLHVSAMGQFPFKKLAPNTYLVQFTNKNNNNYSIDNPDAFLSRKAIERRQRYNISVTEQDLPVTQIYLDTLKSLGLEIYAVSKWLNHAVVYTEDSTKLEPLKNISFIKTKEKPITKMEKITTPFPFEKKKLKIKRENKTIFKYGSGESQIGMLNGHYLHNRGFQGQGMLIGVLDAGFYHADELPAFDSLFANNQILGIKDCVSRDGDVYADGTHGMQVLSTMGGNYPEELVGTAPKADYLLVRTEDGSSENLVEEYYWITGAEFADSCGVDIITSSLGYTRFDDTTCSHKYEDLDGDTAPITIAADIAADKGILVVISAGNEGNDDWKYVSCPADADKNLTVGAVNGRERISSFSSRGPTPDKRIKPDVMAQGSFAYVQGTNKKVTFTFGTSFSCPIMAGATASLWQAFPEFTAQEIIAVIKLSSDNFETPNNDYGYGIPDLAYAYEYLLLLREKRKLEK